MKESGTHMQLLSKLEALLLDRGFTHAVLAASTPEEAARALKRAEDSSKSLYLPLTKEEVFAELDTSEKGLTPREAALRLEKTGPNSIKKVEGPGLASELTKNLFLNLFAALLWAGGAIEADRIADPFANTWTTDWFDGIKYDSEWNPVTYRVLRSHPGDTIFMSADPYAADEFAAEQVIHVFKCDRPGQLRGIPEMVSTLGLFAELRSYTLAVLAAAETAADHAGFLKTTAPTVDVAQADPFSTVEVERRMFQVLPAGWEPGQLKAEQPTTSYGDFRRNILNEAAPAV